MGTRRLVAVMAALVLVSACGGSGGDDASEENASADPVTTMADGGAADATSDDGDAGADAGSGGGDRDGDGDGSSPVDACSLIDIADAEVALDGLEMQLSDDTTPDSCTFEAVDGTMAAIVIVSYQTATLSQTSVDEIAGAMMGMLEDPDADPDAPSPTQPVDSIDGALAIDTGFAPMVLIPNGDDLVSVSIVGGPGGIEAVVSLSETVAGKL